MTIKNKILLDVLALLAGAVFFLAFAPYEISFIAVLSPAILFYSWSSATPSRAFLRGFYFGFATFVMGMLWVYDGLQSGGVSITKSISFAFIFFFVMAIYTALLGLFIRSVFRNTHQLLLYALVLPSSWVLMEWTRGWLFTGNSWLIVGYSQIDSPLKAWAPIGGVQAVSWITILLSSLLVLLSLNLFNKKSNESKKLSRFATIIFIVVSITSVLLSKVEWTTPIGEKLKVSLIQGNIKQKDKRKARFLLVTEDLYVDLIKESLDSDVIITPETAIPALDIKAKALLGLLGKWAKKSDNNILLGISVLDKETRRFYNGAMNFGKTPGVYHKRHLVPFGEFTPFEESHPTLSQFFETGMEHFKRGRHNQPLLNIAGEKAGVLICFEDAFSRDVMPMLPEAKMLIVMSNDALLGDTAGPHQHFQMTRMRALETGRPLMRATNTGLTGFISPDGRVSKIAPQYKKMTLTNDVQPMQGATPFVKFGNMPLIILSVLFLIISLFMSSKFKH